ncbi:MAG: methyltransferase family protein [Acidimicrobiales bacterium]
MIFGVLAVVAAAHIDRGSPALVAVVGRSAYAVLLGLQALAFATQPPSCARDGRAWVWGATLFATFGMVLAPLLPPGHTLWVAGAVAASVQASLAVVGMAIALAAMASLPRAFSLTPQVRRLATSGMYRLSRHPLYLGEGLNIIGIMVATGSLTVVVVTAAVLAAEVVRAGLEERLLRRNFPHYDEVFGSVAHLLPGIW